MSYNNKYKTRKSGRYNNPGQFVPASEQSLFAPPPPPMPPVQPQAKQKQSNLQVIKTVDEEMKPEVKMDTSTVETKVVVKSGEAVSEEVPFRPHWMKSKLPGVKKISNKERRRRQNENLRRLLTPKNALMVLNEMMPSDQIANQFKVEVAPNDQYYKAQNMHNFCADLTVEGTNYKGYGENKLVARNAAAEQAIRDLILRRMTRALAVAEKEGTDGPSANKSDVDVAMDEEALPMIQLASFALHKLFAEWEYEGHKVPQLKVTGSVAATEEEAARAAAPRPAPKPRALPTNAAALHPCMLLTYMRPLLEYREVAAAGDRPQNMTFTMGIDVDGTTYVGQASNKKEARKAAARSACAALFGVTFDPTPSAIAPIPPPLTE